MFRIFSTSGLAYLFVCLVCLVVLHGCGIKKMPLVGLSPTQVENSNLLLEKFNAHKKVDAIDMDVNLSWNYLGNKGGIDTVLLMQPPAWIRMTAVDPLDRPVFILTSDGATFTFTDNHAGKGYQGKITSSLWREYVPEAIKPEFIFPLLGAMLPSDVQYDLTGIDKNGRLWHQYTDMVSEEKKVHRILLDDQGRIDEYLLLNKEFNLMVKISYSDYAVVGDRGQGGSRHWPRLVAIEGKDIKGVFTLKVKKIVSTDSSPLSFFSLSIPPHYQIKEVN